ncbi:type II secretion system protein, partial [mine drainage metagenome]
MKQFFLKLAFGRKWRREFYELLADRVDNGIVLREALERVTARLVEHSPHGLRTEALQYILARFDSGQRLGDALGDLIPENERMLVLAGENSGRISANMRMAANASDAVAEIRSKIVKGMSIPVAMVGMIYGFLFWMGA